MVRIHQVRESLITIVSCAQMDHPNILSVPKIMGKKSKALEKMIGGN